MPGSHGGLGGPPGADMRDSLPPPYSLTDERGRNANTCFGADTRDSSSQSLVPSTVDDSEPSYRGKRRLLIVYIHGFYGNDQSFQSFPAHVHGYVKNAVEDTHVVHSKIYPRYKTYKSVDIAVENFSAWLQPHENPDTDIILVGHSMGGIIAAEVVLLANKSPYSSQLLRHRILGSISMDCPFLGLHPGIIVSGISSLFRPAASPAASEATTPAGEPSSAALSPTTTTNSTVESISLSQIQSTTSVATGQSSLLSSTGSGPATPDADPFFNPPFFNDNSFKERPFKQRLAHFVKKHSSEGVFGAAKNHVLSHLEYGGCLADYPGLHNRYNKIRALENVDELRALRRRYQDHSKGGRVPSRVRFVNYYTISTGIPKPEKALSPRLSAVRSPSRSPSRSPYRSPSRSPSRDRGMTLLDPIPEPEPERSSTPAIMVEPPHSGSERKEQPVSEENTKHGEASSAPDELKAGPPPSNLQSMDGSSKDPGIGSQPEASLSDLGLAFPSSEEALDLPAIPEAPVKPPTPDLTRFTSDDARKQAEKEAKRELKSYEQAVKIRDKTIKERQNIIDKRRKKLEKERAKQQKEAEKLKAKQEKEAEKLRAKEEKEKQKQAAEPANENEVPPEAEPGSDALTREAADTAQVPSLDGPYEADSHEPATAPEAQRSEPAKPPKERKFCVLPRKADDTWVKVFMEGVDEVGAHCGLFVAGAPHYDVLVGDVGHRILEWVQEYLSKEAILQLARETDELDLD